MKRLLPFALTTIGVLLYVGLVTAYRSGYFAKVAEFRRQRSEEVVSDIPVVA